MAEQDVPSGGANMNTILMYIGGGAALYVIVLAIIN